MPLADRAQVEQSSRWQRVTERSDEALGWWPIAWAEHSRLVSAGPQFSGERQHLHLHTARDSQAVWAHDPDAHRRRIDGIGIVGAAHRGMSS